MILIVVLIIINIYIFVTTKQPGELVSVKEKYRILRDHVKNIPEFKKLEQCIVISGYYHKTFGDGIGYNTNKGDEIGLCISGTANEIFHILLHELAHSTVDEYDHSDTFWKNYIKLRDLAVDIGIYEKIPDKRPFCGKHIQDK